MKAVGLRLPNNNLVLYLVLAGLFSVAFVVPVSVGVRLLPSLVRSPARDIAAGDVSMPVSLALTGGERFVRIGTHRDMNPAAGVDYVVWGWFRMRSLPKDNEQRILFQKVSAQGDQLAGYRLVLARVGGAVRPMVLWRDRRGQGGWHTFAEEHVRPGQWYLLALSFRRDRLLGLHVGKIDSVTSRDVRLAGGFELDNPILPVTKAPLRFGSFSPAPYEGVLGPVGVFAGADIIERLPRLLGEMVKHPGDIPTTIPPAAVKVWIVNGERNAGALSVDVKRVVRNGANANPAANTTADEE